MLTQREYDIRQLESELKMQALFDEWRRSFLAERLQEQQQMPNQQSIEQEIKDAPVR